MTTPPKGTYERSRGIAAYAMSVVGPASVIAVKLAIPHLGAHPFVLLLIPVALAALLGGIRPGLLATALATLSADLFFIAPVGELQFSDPLLLATFVAEATAVSVMLEALHRARRRAVRSLQALELSEARLKEASAELARRSQHEVFTAQEGRERAESALRSAEEQLRHAQKMEAIGQLAGGVAHDFNNLLSVVLGYAAVLANDGRLGATSREAVEEIAKAGRRAAVLTRQLLAFSRRQVLEPRVILLNDVLSGIDAMLRRLIGEDLELTMALAPDLHWCRLDPGQMEQVIVNLAVNARDAMPRGGKLTFETANVVLDEDYVRSHPESSVGDHVVLSVSDTGVGMDRETQARIFEPFFTTKARDQGTGLGLSTAYGIVKQSGGTIWVYSEPGRGTTFTVHFPRAAESGARAVPAPPPAPVETRGSETILVVEDDDQVRALVVGILERAGYHVLSARDGVEAFGLAELHQGTIHILLTDVVMPRMGGRPLAERLKELRPGLVVLFMSGYTENAIVHHGELDAGVTFLPKPIAPDALLRKVRQLIDG